MINQATIQAQEQLPNLVNNKFEPDANEALNQIIDSAWQDPVEEYTVDDQLNRQHCIRLNFDNLQSFEVVERQYEQWGIIFNNSLAIRPSNPAFPTHLGKIVLMGSPKNGFLEASFLRPVSYVSALVTSSQRLVLSAYNQAGHLLNQKVLATANLADSDAAMSPNILLSVTANDIASVSFCAFDGQFTLDEFRFCFASVA
jgi:hypothetical protein